MGRLDAEHRNQLVERYFPHASHQVIILSTDTEIEETFLRSSWPFVKRSALGISHQAATITDRQRVV